MASSQTPTNTTISTETPITTTLSTIPAPPTSITTPTVNTKTTDSSITTTTTTKTLSQSPNPSFDFKKMTREYPNEQQFPHANTPSDITDSDLVVIQKHYQIPETHQPKAPSATDRMYRRQNGWTDMPLTLLEKGVRLPLHLFILILILFLFLLGFISIS